MKNIFLLTLIACCFAALIHFGSSVTIRPLIQSQQPVFKPTSNVAFGCSPDLDAIDFASNENRIPLLEGWGTHRMPVTVQNDSANIYFQQGINMYYGFHIIEALASFEKAVTFDSTFAMAHWGKALAYGPNINDLGYSASPEALVAVQKAKAYSGSCTPVEKALIAAMEVRYTPDTSQSRERLNQLYADAMKQVYATYPKHADVGALYADALMVQHPWDLYDRHNNPKSWTPAIVQVLEPLLKAFPNHPGANHYYIHAVEGSKNPERALTVANRLGGMMPGLAHLVHMPSHIYIRSGYYSKGVEVNDAAVNSYLTYVSQYPVTANNTFLYLMHNRHMQAACAAMDGQYTVAMKHANQTRESVDSGFLNAGGYLGMYGQYLYSTPLVTQIRFGKWEDILQVPAIPREWAYANSLLHFGKGMAYARLHQLDKAQEAGQRMKDSIHSAQLQEHPKAFNPGAAVIEVADKVLQGVIAEEKGDLTQAIVLLRNAVELEDGMLYNEPRDWVLPVRHYLGRALVKAKRYREAENVYKEDLAINPNNAWALTGLSKALKGQGKDASTVQQKAKKALERSDITLVNSAF